MGNPQFLITKQLTVKIFLLTLFPLTHVILDGFLFFFFFLKKSIFPNTEVFRVRTAVISAQTCIGAPHPHAHLLSSYFQPWLRL